MDKLKPCPFCGCDASYEGLSEGPYFYVMCPRAFGRRSRRRDSAWNRRAGDKPDWRDIVKKKLDEPGTSL